MPCAFIHEMLVIEAEAQHGVLQKRGPSRRRHSCSVVFVQTASLWWMHWLTFGAKECEKPGIVVVVVVVVVVVAAVVVLLVALIAGAVQPWW